MLEEGFEEGFRILLLVPQAGSDFLLAPFGVGFEVGAVSLPDHCLQGRVGQSVPVAEPAGDLACVVGRGEANAVGEENQASFPIDLDQAFAEQLGAAGVVEDFERPFQDFGERRGAGADDAGQGAELRADEKVFEEPPARGRLRGEGSDFFVAVDVDIDQAVEAVGHDGGSSELQGSSVLLCLRSGWTEGRKTQNGEGVVPRRKRLIPKWIDDVWMKNIWIAERSN